MIAAIELALRHRGDLATFGSQVTKLAERFGCQRMILVGDRSMIKTGHMENLSREGFQCINAITKPEIMTLVRRGIVYRELFDAAVCEVEHEGVRCILRRNLLRAEEVAAKRADNLAGLQRFLEKYNTYLAQHPRARLSTAQLPISKEV